MSAKAWDIFVNVDGQHGRTLCPLPHAQLDNVVVDRATVEKWDQVSCHERFQQIKHKLTAEEQGLLVSLLLHISGGHMETSSLWDMIRSHALLMHSSDNFGDVWLRYKLRDGQTELARRIFADAVDSGLEYAFSTQVASVAQDRQTDQPSTVRTVAGEAFRARKVVCTVPLNVLKDVAFEPALSARRREAINIGHINQMSKIHADVGNPELERWNGMRFPGQLLYGYSDGVLPNGDVHLVAFGADQRGSFVPEKEPLKAVDALQKLHPMDVKSLVSRDKTGHFVARDIVLTNLNYPADLPQLVHRSLLAGRSCVVATWLYVQVPGRAPEPPRQRLLRLRGLGTRVEGVDRWGAGTRRTFRLGY